jgi:hypothetical protein
MKLGSVEYKQLLNSFGEDVQEINDDLYQATKPKTDSATRAATLERARKKLTDYDRMLGQLEGAQKKTAEDSFAELITEMRSFVDQLED